MTIQELILKINVCCEENDIYFVSDLFNEMGELVNLYDFEYVKSTERDENRWYVLDKDIYSVVINNEKYFIGTWVVNTIKNESMTDSDCGCVLSFTEMEEYQTTSYRNKY